MNTEGTRIRRTSVLWALVPPPPPSSLLQLSPRDSSSTTSSSASSSAMPSSLDQDAILTCLICCEHYTTEGRRVPRMLRCGHTLCHMCVEYMMIDWVIVCPVCRQSTTASKYNEGGGVVSLPANEALISVVEARNRATSDTQACECEESEFMAQEHTGPKCGNCEDEISSGIGQFATTRCMQCNMDYCGTCFDQVHSAKVKKCSPLSLARK
jgi:hypothetical protein